MRTKFFFAIISIFTTFSLYSQERYWKDITPFSSKSFEKVKINPKTNEVYTGAFGEFYRSNDSGKTWINIYGSGLPESPKEDIVCFDFDKNGYIFLSLFGSDHFFKSSNLGLNYTNIVKDPLCNYPQVIGFIPKNDMMFAAVSDFDACAYLLKSVNGGNTYSYSYRRTIPNVGPANITKFAFKQDTIFISDATGGSGQFSVYRSTDNGSTWTGLSNGLPVPAKKSTSVAIDKFGNIYLGFKDDSGIYKSINNGNSWQIVNDSLSNKNINDLTASPDGDIYAATEGGVFILPDGSDKWQLFLNNIGFYETNVKTLALNSDGNIVYAASSGKVYKTEDARYIEITAPAKNDTLFIDSTYTIKWKSSGIYEPLQVILIQMGAVNVKLLADTLKNTGEFFWSPINAIPDMKYKIIVRTLNYKIMGISDTFTIINKKYPMKKFYLQADFSPEVDNNKILNQGDSLEYNVIVSMKDSSLKIENAEVSIFNEVNDEILNLKTDSAGFFYYEFIVPMNRDSGEYAIKFYISKIGFEILDTIVDIIKIRKYVGVNEDINKLNKNYINIIPNPANDKLTIRLINFDEGEVLIEFYDIKGSMILQKQELVTNFLSQDIYFETNKLITGDYIIKIIQGDNQITGKLILKK